MKLSNIPLIKWSGTKRTQAPDIIKYFPKNINNYYEPFCGSCAITYELLKQIYLGNISCKQIICSDINVDLINFYNLFLRDKNLLFNEYEKLFNELINCKYIDKKKDFYFNIRNKFNLLNYNDERTCLFYWLSRTCYNGLIRYNSKGEFNSSYHLNRNGILPEKLKLIFDSWHFLINHFISNNGVIKFYNKSYEDILIDLNENDFIYLDPPYYNTKGMYSNKFDDIKFFNKLEELNNKNIKFLLSYVGIRGENNKTVEIPKFYTKHLYLKSGNSSFSKLKNNNIEVFESLYLNF